jgi:hypothetical protein
MGTDVDCIEVGRFGGPAGVILACVEGAFEGAGIRGAVGVQAVRADAGGHAVFSWRSLVAVWVVMIRIGSGVAVVGDEGVRKRGCPLPSLHL